ncbi:MAG TPA: ABC transporter permease [Bacteroidales bacterium]|nr:ABC transporter permease [Bacteroidales bacterium]
MNGRTRKRYLFSKNIDLYLTDIYDGFKFVTRFFREVFRKPFYFKETVNQCFEIGIRSLGLISITGFIVGFVFVKQSRPSLESFGATSWLPSLMGIASVRALGPLVTALITAGKVGSGIGAELGSMKVTEQIDAMEVSAINPFKYLVVTRVVAATVSIFILALYCDMVELLGSYMNINSVEGITAPAFFRNAFSSLTFLDLFTNIIKAVSYGFTIGIVGCYKGFNANSGTRGVGMAANQAVVLSIFLIFLEEFIIVQVINWIRYL